MTYINNIMINKLKLFGLKQIIIEYLRLVFRKFNLDVRRIDANQKKLIYKFLRKIFIIDSGHKLVRIGKNGDGGYLMPSILKQIDYCFSAGVGKITSFEDHLLQYKIKSFLADGTVNYNGPHDFLKKNINHYNDKKNITLDVWINKKLKNKVNNNLLLQMDIEGAEIETLYQTDIEILKRFKCIIIEFHNFDYIVNSLGLKIYSQIFSKILKNHLTVHIHPNNSNFSTLINGCKIPKIMEFTFINKNIIKYSKPITYKLPHELDQKNNINLEELILPKIFYTKI